MADIKSREVVGVDEAKEGSDLTSIKLSIDVSEALAGLKAVQREAKAASRAVKELEAARLSEVPTKELIQELSRRKNVMHRRRYDFVEQVPRGMALLVTD